MKKLALTLAIVLGLSMYSFAGMDNQGGGLFGYGKSAESNNRDGNGDGPILPGGGGHGGTSNADGDQAPLGSGIVALIGFGAAYAIAKKRED